MADHCVPCKAEHSAAERCGWPKDINEAREFFLNSINVFSGDGERFARETAVLRDFILKADPDKIRQIYHELLGGLTQGFKKMADKDEAAHH